MSGRNLIILGIALILGVGVLHEWDSVRAHAPEIIETAGQKRADCDSRAVIVNGVRIGCQNRENFADQRKIDLRSENRALSNRTGGAMFVSAPQR